METEIEKMSLESKDLVAERIDQVKALFPEIVTEGEASIDFEKLRLILGDEVDEGQERYAFTWPGKTDAIRQAQIPSTATLRPDKESSVDWDTTENLYIEGDNLEVLKLLQRGYHGKVKMIYIDPPYNTGHDFVYKDSFQNSIENYKEQAGLSGQSNADTNGRYHSDWLSMMYPRLRLARELLSDDGIIFISIGENEIAHLKEVCDEVFGEQNSIPIYNRVTKKSSNNGDNFSPCIDYVLGYAKNIERLPEFTVPLSNEIRARYKHKDEYCLERGPYQEVGLFQAALKHGGSNYPITCPDGEKVIPPNGQPWRWNQETYCRGLEEGRICFKRSDRTGLLDADTGKQAHWNIYTKVYLNEREEKGIHPKNFSDEFQNTLATNELRNLGMSFDFSKPTSMIAFFLSLVVAENDIVLDFFSGSGTTAHASMELNARDGAACKFILVQLPESQNSEFATLCQLAEERMRRAGQKIKAKIEEGNKQLKLGEEPKKVPDIGFRVLKLDSSNFDKVEGGTLVESIVKADRTHEDIIFEMMVKWGLDLSLPMEETEVLGYPITSIAADELICCMDEGLTIEVLEAIAALEPKRVFFLDSVLTDTAKLNAAQIFKRASERSGIEIELRTV